MAHIIWSNDLSVGIEIIDSQHKRIVDYLNELDDARLHLGAVRRVWPLLRPNGWRRWHCLMPQGYKRVPIAC